MIAALKLPLRQTLSALLRYTHELKTPSLAVDALVLRSYNNAYDVLLVTRKYDPFRGRLAFPGGAVDYGEDPEDACVRELREECGVEGRVLELADVAGKPGRDPRRHVVSVVYRVEVEENVCVKAGDDAAHAEFYPLQKILKDASLLAFDHYDILKRYIRKSFPSYCVNKK
eukprot:TRINITY_DN12636_c0_g1_i2.p1 TRINITY_DN12636_c0_g1~~TRINITY_DN12636_c0_g1_i2.p1  ORF type:complete len:171 (+),score=29.81 TRINITY_DN12636_c0_g1_i2:147-659(+)